MWPTLRREDTEPWRVTRGDVMTEPNVGAAGLVGRDGEPRMPAVHDDQVCDALIGVAGTNCSSGLASS